LTSNVLRTERDMLLSKGQVLHCLLAVYERSHPRGGCGEQSARSFEPSCRLARALLRVLCRIYQRKLKPLDLLANRLWSEWLHCNTA
jgi:hypothetical protein